MGLYGNGRSPNGRFYHNQQHLAHMLQLLQQYPPADKTTVYLAAWFHDAIYDPQKGDNEAQSAALAEARLSAIGVPSAQMGRVSELIRATQTHEVTADDVDGKLFVDADLAIFGEVWERYWGYAQAIRQEYGFVSEELYRQGRTAVLSRFLARPIIYRTAVLFDRFEQAARHNIAREITYWQGIG